MVFVVYSYFQQTQAHTPLNFIPTKAPTIFYFRKHSHQYFSSSININLTISNSPFKNIFACTLQW